MLKKNVRINTVDALRGFAIIGILLLHSIEHFNFLVYPDNATQSDAMVALNKNIWESMFFIFGSKTYGIFALLFGFTFYLQFSKQEKKNQDFGPRFLWRMVILFVFGWVNSILFPGEILLIYAILSPSLFLIRKWSNKYVLIFSIIFLLQPLELYNVIGCYLNPDFTPISFYKPIFWKNTMEYLNSGSIFCMIKNSYNGFFSSVLWSINVGRISQTIGLFAMGLFLGRLGIFEQNRSNFRKWTKVLVTCLLLFTFSLAVKPLVGEEKSYLNNSIGILHEVWKNLFQLFSMVSLFVILSYTKIFQRITKPIYAYGRMSLSNYIMQSLVGGLLFFPYGFGLAYKLNIFHSLILGMLLAVFFIIFCNWWIKKFKQGPMEKLWHNITWHYADWLHNKIAKLFRK